MAAELRSNNPSERKDVTERSSMAPNADVNRASIDNAADGLAINQLSLNELSTTEHSITALSTNELSTNELVKAEGPTAYEPTAEAALSRPSATNRRPLRHERTDGTTILSLYHFGWSAIYLVGALIMAIPTMITGIVGLADDPEIFWVTGLLGIATFFVLGLSLLFFVVGFGLWRLRQWARTAAIAIALVSLPTVLGTIPAALTLWYLFKEEVSSIFR